MEFKTLKLTKEKFGYPALYHSIKYSCINKLHFYKELQGMTVTMDSLDPKYLEGNEKYTYRFLTNEELKEYSKDENNFISPEFLEHAIEKGDYCYAVLDGDVLASYGWYSAKPTEINEELSLHFDDSWIYMFKGYTSLDYRGQRLHAIGMARSLKAFAEKGFKGIISYVETNNYASLRSCERMGYKNFGKVCIKKTRRGFRINPEESCAEYSFTVKAKHPFHHN
ncbi:MAG: GNAT family acetyltransferase [Calditrichaeota bacterium]|nr:GNAT family acetyltransferase [Calditrichota bacterium]